MQICTSLQTDNHWWHGTVLNGDYIAFNSPMSLAGGRIFKSWLFGEATVTTFLTHVGQFPYFLTTAYAAMFDTNNI